MLAHHFSHYNNRRCRREVSEWPVWSAPHTHGNFKLERLMILNLWYTNSIIGQEIRVCPSLLYTRPWVPSNGWEKRHEVLHGNIDFSSPASFKIDTKNVFVTRSFLSKLAIFFIIEKAFEPWEHKLHDCIKVSTLHDGCLSSRCCTIVCKHHWESFFFSHVD